MARRVDLPAPFGPSRATISPARQVSETRLRARRRPKFLVTSRNVSVSKSRSTGGNSRSGGSRRGSGRAPHGNRVVVQRGVDALEGGDQLPPPIAVALRIDRLLALPLFERRELLEQPIAGGLELLTPGVVRRRRRAGANRRPRTTGKDHDREHEGERAGPRRMMR